MSKGLLASTAVSRRHFAGVAAISMPLVFWGRKLFGAPVAKNTGDLFAGLKVLRREEWVCIGVLVNQIFPKTASAPSASEAGVLTFLSNALGNRFTGWVLLPFRKLMKKRPALGRSGFSQYADHYRKAVVRLNELSVGEFQKHFIDITEADRQKISAKFSAAAKADVGYNILGTPTAKDASDKDLFELIRRHVIEGYFSDPVHGGNRNYLAWEAVGHTCHMNYPKEQKCGNPP